MSKEITEEQVKPNVEPKVIMKWFDMWHGNLVVIKQKRILGTGQTQVTQVQFQFTDPKPKKSVSVTQKNADFWNATHFTARFQSTELMFPQGKKLDYWWIYNEETEEYDFIVKELQTV